MKSRIGWKSVLIGCVVFLFLYGIFGLPRRFSEQDLAHDILRRIHLGLDLKGGTHLILQVQVDEAVRAEAQQKIEQLRDALQRQNIAFTNAAEPDPANHPDQILVSGVPVDRTSDFRDIITKSFPDYTAASGPNNTWLLSMKSASLSQFKQQTVTQAIETLRNRVDQLGVTQPAIEKYGIGNDEILVELPGVSDPARVKSIMQSTAMLEVRQAFGSYPSEQAAYAANNGILPPGQALLTGESQQPGNAAPQNVYYLVSRIPAITGRDLRAGGASVASDETDRPEVNFTLTSDGAKKFAAFTGAHIGGQLAVVLDNKVMEVAVIQQQISDSGRITGNFTEQSAKDLALVLNSGALPASIHYLQESTIGPTLGADSIRDGVRAAIIGMLAVLMFMPLYYRGAGINADIALILNLVILPGFLGFTGATLTLPGIAGVILTVGMGVDSNVLIFERIREEVHNRKPAAAAVEQGFAHAWVTIVDTHITTIVSAAILFLFGTGPVRGFAVTLTFGLLANLFTAVFVSRTIFDFVLDHKARGEALSI